MAGQKVNLAKDQQHIRWVIYDFHPERNRLERKSTWPPFRQWINSRADFRIRARLSDGREVSAWLLDALREGEKGNEDAERAIQTLEALGEDRSPFKVIRDWSRTLAPLAPAEASSPQEYLPKE
jgi:hypothetical protein